ncbi:hypothetical protein EPI10_015871 [Gossypium australe]|uniref:Uncharacterized protein n=1 Tax=Gossypium australe TaxID=47621 RepID=A0A5B6VLJ1_9ROSI|nr:hypothetical protein EPI10_015871 [Gossypium australe]
MASKKPLRSWRTHFVNNILIYSTQRKQGDSAILLETQVQIPSLAILFSLFIHSFCLISHLCPLSLNNFHFFPGISLQLCRPFAKAFTLFFPATLLVVLTS